MSRVSLGPTSLPPSRVPHAPADKGAPPLPNFLTLGSRSTGFRGKAGTLSEALGRRPGALAKAAGCTCLSQRQQQSPGRGARVLASQVQASCFRAAPPRPRGRRRPLAAEPGPSCGAPPGAPARCLSRYSSCKGLPAKRGAN